MLSGAMAVSAISPLQATAYQEQLWRCRLLNRSQKIVLVMPRVVGVVVVLVMPRVVGVVLVVVVHTFSK